MIEGTVAGGIEAILPLELMKSDGGIEQIEAVVDTGFTGDLTLPPSLVRELGLEEVSTNEITLADGSTTEVPVFAAPINWFGTRKVFYAIQTDSTPLIGMRLMHSCRPAIDMIAEGSVSLQQI